MPLHIVNVANSRSSHRQVPFHTTGRKAASTNATTNEELHLQKSVCKKCLRLVAFVSAVTLLASQLIAVSQLNAQDGGRQASNAGYWSHMNSPTQNALASVSATSVDDAWAVGIFGTTLHWDGISWQSVASPTSNHLSSVDTVAASDAWAVGAYGTILHWNGGPWHTITSPTSQNLAAVDMVASNYGWAVGTYGTILHWNGSSWQSVASPTSAHLRSVSAISTTLAWAVGVSSADIRLGSGGVILRWDGNSWEKQDVPYDMYSVAALSQDYAWASGTFWFETYPPTTRLMHWDGSSWQVDASVSDLGTPYSIALVSENEGWAVGSMGTILQWDGVSWQSAPSPTSSHLFSLDMIASDKGLAVGANGTLLRYWVPSSWTYLTIVLKEYAP